MSVSGKGAPVGPPTGWRTIARADSAEPPGEDASTATHISFDSEPSTAMLLTFGEAPAAARAADSGDDPRIGTVLEDRYVIAERIGAGGMAVVYRAQERGFIKRDVAIKLLSPESALSEATIQRFLQEAQAISDIGHPHVVHIHHVGQTADGQLYLVMELLRGQTLAQALTELKARGEVFPWERLGPMILQICGALQAAHRRNIIHRDIKPGNCFRIDVDGNPDYIKVLDFGIAKIQTAHSEDDGSEDAPLTQQGMFVGTPHYAAPETIAMRPDWPIDGRADQFAVGVMMYQMLTGSLPFAGASKLDALYKTAHERPPSPRERAPQREIAADVDALVMRAMASDPRQRFPSMRALSEAIYATLSMRPRTLPPDVSNPHISLSPQGELVRFETTPSPDRAPRRESTGPGTPMSALSGVMRRESTGPGTPAAAEDLATPAPTGSEARPQEVVERTGVEALEAAPTSRAVFVAAAAMLLGLVVVAGVLVYETGKAPAMVPAAASVATPREAPPRVAPPKPSTSEAPTKMLEDEVELPPLEDESQAGAKRPTRADRGRARSGAAGALK